MGEGAHVDAKRTTAKASFVAKVIDASNETSERNVLGARPDRRTHRGANQKSASSEVP